MSDLGNQHNNGPHQDQILLSGIVCQKLDLVSGGTDVVVLSLSPFFSFLPSDLLWLRSSIFKYNASAVNYLLVVVFCYTLA